jgi:hypothetical protein
LTSLRAFAKLEKSGGEFSESSNSDRAFHVRYFLHSESAEQNLNRSSKPNRKGNFQMKTINDEVTVTSKGLDGAEVTKKAPVSYSEYETADDVLAFLTKADEKGLKQFLGTVNYGVNLKARAAVRSTLLDSMQGPDKAVNKAVDMLVKAMHALGKTGFTEADARAQIAANAA